MSKCFKGAINFAAVILALTASAAASAQSAGTWSAKVGINQLKPKVDSGDLSAPALPGTKADVGTDTEPVFVGSYMITDNISAELALGVPYKFDLKGAGAIAGTGKIGTTEALPPTIFVQYRFFEPKSTIRPYAGLGLTYSYFQKETGSGQMTALTNTGSPNPTTFKMDNKFCITTQLGATYAINEKWFADFALTKTFLKTTAHFSTGQTQNIKLDPLGISFGVGYHF
ncbi:OmpW family outer membrane protein [Undibacterium sp. RTI2.1]|nr:OmpW family outer membrane protein [Undibacterium sp. RTI2.1]MEB0117316.1 OmpW family outer membrane protein [Undibacterium sp. RTI2.2]MEB0231027.1 OmpW family outer membrane protein [Undibacterium sp. 10I3]MEB0257790.1 OmpW family outer membrane protein [Undibacterium sp. 5I1]